MGCKQSHIALASTFRLRSDLQRGFRSRTGRTYVWSCRPVSAAIEPQAFVLGSLTVTRMSPDAPGCLVFSFHDSDGVRRQIADHSGNVQRLIDAAAQPFTAVPTQSGNTKKDF